MKLSKHVARTGLATGLAITAASAVAFTAPVAAQAAPPPKPHEPGVTPMYARCGQAGPNLDTATGTLSETVALRTGSGTNCAQSGQAQPDQTLDYYCYTVGGDGHTWTYVKDLATGARGWIRDDQFPDTGSRVYCGF